MPVTNHSGNTTNGNAIGKLAGTVATLRGRTTQLSIYEIAYATLSTNPLMGENFTTIVASMEVDDMEDAEKGYRQPTNHDDRLGNLPVAPGGNVAYREYFLPGNKFAWSGFVRLVADVGSKRLFITPTHYDVYLVNADAAKRASQNDLIAHKTKDAHNPFFLITGAGTANPIFA